VLGFFTAFSLVQTEAAYATVSSVSESVNPGSFTRLSGDTYERFEGPGPTTGVSVKVGGTEASTSRVTCPDPTGAPTGNQGAFSYAGSDHYGSMSGYYLDLYYCSESTTVTLPYGASKISFVAGALDTNPTITLHYSDGSTDTSLSLTAEPPSTAQGNVFTITPASGEFITSFDIQAEPGDWWHLDNLDYVSQTQNQVWLSTPPFQSAGSPVTLAAEGGSGTGAISFALAQSTQEVFDAHRNDLGYQLPASDAGCSLTGGNVLSKSTPGTCYITITKAGDSTYGPWVSTGEGAYDPVYAIFFESGTLPNKVSGIGATTSSGNLNVTWTAPPSSPANFQTATYTGGLRNGYNLWLWKMPYQSPLVVSNTVPQSKDLGLVAVNGPQVFAYSGGSWGSVNPNNGPWLAYGSETTSGSPTSLLSATNYYSYLNSAINGGVTYWELCPYTYDSTFGYNGQPGEPSCTFFTVDSSGNFVAPISSPTISGISPSSGPTTGGTLVTITGTAFANGATVTIGGTACDSVTVVSSTSITCSTRNSAYGSANLVITNSDSGTVTANSAFTYKNPITNFAIGLTAPVTSGVPDASTLDNGQFTSTVTWSPNNNPFLPNTIETATITVTPDSTYTLSGVSANSFTVAGASSVTNNASGGTVTAVFPATAIVTPRAPTIGSASQTGQTTATVAFTAPSSNGGSSITGYIVTATPTAGSILVETISATTSPLHVTGLSPATTYSFIVAAINSVGTGISSGSSNSVTTPGPLTSTVAVSSKTVTAGTALTPFTPVTGAGGTAPLSYSISPSLPSSLSLNSSTGAITGTPNSPLTTTTFTETVTDAATPTPATSTVTFTLGVNAAVTTSLGTVPSSTYTNTTVTPFIPITAAGGVAPMSFAISPSLPSGLTFDTATGQVSGTPTGTSSGTYQVTATDVNGSNAHTSFSLAVTVSPLIANVSNASISLTQNSAATPFSPATVTGGSGAITYTISPSLPTGLTLSSSTGIISGTPTALLSSATFTETATDSASPPDTVTATFALSVVAPTPPSPPSSGGGYTPPVIAPTPTPTPTPSPSVTPSPAPTSTPKATPTPTSIPIPTPTPTSVPIPTPTPAPKPSPSTNAAPSTSPSKSSSPAIPVIAAPVVAAAKAAILNAPVAAITSSAVTALPSVAPSTPVKVSTVASSSGTALAVVITSLTAVTKVASAPSSYVVAVTNTKTGAVTTQIVPATSATQTVPLAGLQSSSNYAVVVIAQTVSGAQFLVTASKVSTPAPVTEKVTPISNAVANQVTIIENGTKSPIQVLSKGSVDIPVTAPALASSISTATTANGTALAVTINPPAVITTGAATPTSYSVLVSDKTTGITTTQDVQYAASTPSSVVIPGLTAGDNYAVAVVANSGSSTASGAPAVQDLVAATVVSTPSPTTPVSSKKNTGIKLTQTPHTADAANAPQIVKVTPKVSPHATSGNSATIDLSNLKPGQRVQVVLKGATK